jgi:hypothetical protein
MGETESKDKVCLIIFDELKEGDELFHILRGPVIVTELMEYDKDNPYRIGFTYQEDEAYPKIKTGTNDDSCTITGRLYTKDKYPAIYRIDPFKYTTELLKDSEIKLKNLNARIGISDLRMANQIGMTAGMTVSKFNDMQQVRQLEVKDLHNYAKEQLDLIRRKEMEFLKKLKEEEKED